jgi:hypothetical protein
MLRFQWVAGGLLEPCCALLNSGARGSYKTIYNGLDGLTGWGGPPLRQSALLHFAGRPNQNQQSQFECAT